ncbi:MULTISPECIES: extensin family protein [unclassified Afipia]|uniref:extensin family protein n=1 Tax=unclassified Afipia TaxID=2642050 RepID=UPI000467EA0E|nr:MULTISPECIES: extensin family protein [unclassified Afipia]MAH67708.1 extensin family protein [Afipia sp.]OUX63166.1 MAG: extensin family protein [Afipia sp. TMED4]HCX17059.1 extensin family protein [Afipia sp.]
MNFSADHAARKWPCDWHATGRLPVLFFLALAAVLTCAASMEASANVPLPRPRPADAPAAAEPEGGPPDQAPSVQEPAEARPPELSACRKALTEDIAIAPSIPPIKGPGGCGGEDLVRLEAIVLSPTQRVALKPAAILRCTMAAAVADWIRTDMAPLAAKLGTTISELDNFDSFECRGRNRVRGAKLSEHGLANALDVRGMTFANGNKLSLTDRTASREIREKVLASVCTRFTTVLGPSSDWYHEDHIHLDLAQRRGNYKLCQWGVHDPLPAVAPLLPAERPEEAPPRPTAEEKAASGKPSEAAPEAASEDDDGKPAAPAKPRGKLSRRSGAQ